MSEDLQPVRQRKQEERTRDTTYPPAPEPLAVAVADSHCHLDIRDGQTWLDVGQALDMAAAVGVNRIVQIGFQILNIRPSRICKIILRIKHNRVGIIHRSVVQLPQMTFRHRQICERSRTLRV